MDPSDAGNRTGGQRPEPENPRPGRALVAAGPSPSMGPRQRPEASAAFIAQLAAAHLADPGQGDRRASRRPELVLPRARAAYASARRLATELEPGFLVKRSF